MNNEQEIISRLKFIGKIKKGEKINTKHMYVQPDGFNTSISRTFLNQDNRGNALNFCQETVARAFELLITYERSERNSDKTIFKNLVKDLQEAITGLVNLKFTYIIDTKFCCDMDTILENIHARLQNYIAPPPAIEQKSEPSTPIDVIQIQTNRANSMSNSLRPKIGYSPN
jgi:hypothetical protein